MGIPFVSKNTCSTRKPTGGFLFQEPWAEMKASPFRSAGRRELLV
jgi:hypothetical protein